MTANLWIGGTAALGVTLLLTPLVRQVCFLLQLYDVPGPLKIHLQPIPRLGGIAIVLALATGVHFAGHHAGTPEWPFFTAVALICTMGLLDDIRGLSPSVRIAAEIAGAAILWQAGWRIPLAGHSLLSLMATSLFVVVLVNAFNFIDGADGIAAGVAAIIALGYVLLPADAHTWLGAACAWSMLGACSGFLAFNFPPAKIFMGDCGSMALGFVVAFLGLDSCRTGVAGATVALFPMLSAAFPLLDLTLAVIRRLQNRAPPFSGDRRHLYDLLLNLHWRPRRVALACYALTAIMVLAAWITRRSGDAFAVLLVCGLIVCVLFAEACQLGALRSEERRQRVNQLGT